jgi:SAM-dependent methyltransferase
VTADVTDAPDIRREIDVARMNILRGILAGFTPGRVIDLACGTGMFAVLAADLGWQVTAVDARSRPWADLRVTWRQQDIRDTDLNGFDLVLCLGIFYHLELADQVKLLGKCSGTPLILDTHMSMSGAETEGGYAGHWYPEPDGVLSAWRNTRSWWPSLRSLKDMLTAAGYGTVNVLEPWYHGGDRTFFTCLP